jgi:hypothetical protein
MTCRRETALEEKCQRLEAVNKELQSELQLRAEELQKQQVLHTADLSLFWLCFSACSEEENLRRRTKDLRRCSSHERKRPPRSVTKPRTGRRPSRTRTPNFAAKSID